MKKAAKDVISLEDINVEGPQLDTIIEEWRKSNAKLDPPMAPSSYVTSVSSGLHRCKLINGTISRLDSDSECEFQYESLDDFIFMFGRNFSVLQLQ